MRKALGFLCLAVLTTSCSGGTSVTPANAPLPVVRAGDRVLSAPGSRHVTIAEVSVPVQPFALAVDANGAVYFASDGSGLYRYFGGTFVQTQPWSDPACIPSPDACFIAIGGASAIDAVGVPSPVWASSYIRSFGFGTAGTILLVGGSGGAATRRPAQAGVGYVVSLITARTGAIWMGGVDRLYGLGPCCDPEGDPAAVPYAATNGALVLANGPRKHVWGTIVAFGAPAPPAPPAETIFEYSDTGAILHSYPLPSGTEIGGIGTGDGLIIGSLISGGPDDSLWFTDRGHNAVGRIDAKGKVTEYPVPTPNSGVLGIALAADGKLWFTETNADKVGRIDASGRIAEFSLPTKNAQPMAIVANPPGGLCDPNVVWVAEFNGEKIAEITF